MKATFLFTLLFLVCLSAFASEDRPFPWQALTLDFGYGLDDPETKGILRISTRDWRISELNVQWNGTSFSVPKSEFESLPNPQLETVKVLRGQFYGDVYDNAPYIAVELRFGKPTFGEYQRAHFLFFSGRYHDLRITTRTSETTWQDSVKVPGKEIQQEGKTTLLLPDTTETAIELKKSEKDAK